MELVDFQLIGVLTICTCCLSQFTEIVFVNLVTFYCHRHFLAQWLIEMPSLSLQVTPGFHWMLPWRLCIVGHELGRHRVFFFPWKCKLKTQKIHKTSKPKLFFGVKEPLELRCFESSLRHVWNLSQGGKAKRPGLVFLQQHHFAFQEQVFLL